jgi:hypothetical protein
MAVAPAASLTSALADGKIELAINEKAKTITELMRFITKTYSP